MLEPGEKHWLVIQSSLMMCYRTMGVVLWGPVVEQVRTHMSNRGAYWVCEGKGRTES